MLNQMFSYFFSFFLCVQNLLTIILPHSEPLRGKKHNITGAVLQELNPHPEVRSCSCVKLKQVVKCDCDIWLFLFRSNDLIITLDSELLLKCVKLILSPPVLSVTLLLLRGIEMSQSLLKSTTLSSGKTNFSPCLASLV